MKVQISGNKRSRVSLVSVFVCALLALSLFGLTAEYALAGVIPGHYSQISRSTGPKGTRVSDTLILTPGPDGAGQPAPSLGTVSFFLCGPTFGTAPVPCPVGSGVQVGGPVTLSTNTPAPGQSRAVSALSAQLAIAGWYCFRTVYSGDQNLPGGGGYSEGPYYFTETTNECIFIDPSLPSAVTVGSFNAQPQSVAAMSIDKSMGWVLGIAGILALGLTAVVLIRKR